MRERDTSRREFLRTTVAASAAVAFAAIAKGRAAPLFQEAKAPALERRKFGKTDMVVTVLGFAVHDEGVPVGNAERVSIVPRVIVTQTLGELMLHDHVGVLYRARR